MAADLEVEKRLKESFGALQHYFSPSRKQEGTGNPAQLVLFAEHAAKVSWELAGWETLLNFPCAPTEWVQVCCRGQPAAVFQSGPSC